MSVTSGKQRFPKGPRPDAPRKDQRNCCKGPDCTARRKAVVLMVSKDNGSYLPKFWPLDPQLADAMRYAVLLLAQINCEVTSGTIRPTAEHPVYLYHPVKHDMSETSG